MRGHFLRRWAGVPIAAMTLVGTCDGQSQEPSFVAADAIQITQVTYTAQWNRGGATLVPGGGWTVTTDLGYQVEVRGGYMVSYRASLTACEAPSGDSTLARLWRGLGVSVAHASDGEELDPSATTRPQVEWLAAPTSILLGTLAFTSTQYCGIHYLVARGDGSTFQLPSDVGMIGRSLYLEGSYLAPGAHTPVEFVVDTSEGTGVLVPVDAAVDETLLTGGGAAQVTIDRRLDTLTDRIDFSSIDPEGIAHEVLRNLARGTTVTVEVVAADSPAE